MAALSSIIKVQNVTTCVGGDCSAAAVNKTGLSKEQDNIAGVYTALAINTIIGAACLFGFLVLRTFMKQYQLRLHLPAISVRPPPFPNTSWGKVFGWLKPVFMKSDAFVLRSAGLDALVLLKSFACGLQICLPIAIIGCCFLMPLQISERYIVGDASYGRLTAANIVPRSNIMWAHCVCMFVFLAWVFTLLEYHTRQYASVRQHYLKGGDDANYWRDLHMAEADGTLVHRQAKLLDVLGEVRHEEELAQLEKALNSSVQSRRWYQRALVSLTSWTGQESVEAAAQHAVVGRSRSRSRSRAATAGSSGPSSPAAGERSGHLHLDLAGDIISGDIQKETKLHGTSSPTCPTHSPAAADGGGEGGTAASTLAAGGSGGSGAHLHSLATMEASRGRSPGDDGIIPAPPACCNMEAEQVSNLVAHKWWAQVEHVSTTDGKLRRVTAEEVQDDDVQRVMLAKPSVRYRKTVNATDRRGRRTAVNAQQYAVLVTNVDQPCYPEFMHTSHGVPGAGKCGNLSPDAIPHAVKHELEGPLHGHAEVERPGGGPPESKYTGPSAASTATKQGSKDTGDVELGLSARSGSSGGSRQMVGHATRHIHTAACQNAVALPSLSSANGANGKGPSSSSGSGGADGGNGEGGGEGSGRTRSGPELWGLVRAAAADKRLQLLGRSVAYSSVASIFSSLFPDDYDRVVPVFNYRRVDLLMRRWDNLQGRLEKAEFTLARTGVRPMCKTKCCGGIKVDAIDWLTAEINRLEPLILKERDAAMIYGQTPSWFVLFRSQKAAAIAASCNILPMNQDLFQVHPAPGPEEVNWESLWFNHGQRVLRGWLTAPFTILVVLLPVSLLTSAISSLNDEFCKATHLAFYCNNKLLRGVVTGFLPSLLIVLWQGLAMPRLIYLVAQSEGRHFSLSHVDRRMGEIYFYWDIFNMFAQGVLGAAAVDAAAGTAAIKQSTELFNAPTQVPNIIGKALPASSKFFVNYIIMRTLMTVPLRFLITQPGVWQCWLRLLDLFSGPVPLRVTFMRLAIRSPRYGVEYGSMLLIMLISLAFALISPIIILFGAAFCAGMWLFWRYQLLYNYQRKYESGGLMWQFFVNRVLVCCGIMVVFTGCVLIIKQGFVQGALVWLFGVISTISFASHLNRRYMNAIIEMPLYLANQAPRTRVPSSTYVPPPLQANGLGWYPEFNKVWEFFGMPGYSY